MSSYYEKILATGEVKCIDEEIPFEVPQGWEWERFGNVMINKDSERIPLSVAQRQHLKKTYDYYGASGVIDKVDKYLFDKDLLLIGEDGANLINRSTPIAFIAKGKYWVNNHAHVLDVCSGMELSYVALFINAISLVDYVTGTAQPKMNQEKMNSILLAIPPVKEQHRILEKMSMVDAFIDKYASLQTKLDSLDNSVYELLRKSILQEAIQGKLVPQLAEEGTAQELLEQIKIEKQKLVKEGKLKKSALNDSVIFKGDDNKYYTIDKKEKICIDDEMPFDIPDTWQWCRLGTLFSHCTGKALNASNLKGALMTYITTSNLYWNRFELDNLKRMRFTDEEIEKCTATFGDLLVCEGGDIGRAAIWNYPYDIRIQNHIHKLRAYKQLCTKFFFWVFYFYKATGRIGGKGIGIQGLSSKALDNILIPLPPLKEQQRIVVQIEKLFEQLR